MFEFLFKYSPIAFSEGRIAVNYEQSFALLVGVVIAFAFCLLLFYKKTTLELSSAFKATMIALKLLALSILLLLLLEPYLTVSAVMPRKSSVVILVDDSKSMSIRDVDGKKRRSDYVGHLLGDPEKPGLLDELKQNFKVQMYKFSSGIDHLALATDLTANGNITDLASSLNFASEIGQQGAVSAVVVLTDGVNNSDKDPLEVAALMKNKNLPVYLVGVGSEDSKDIELTKVTANRSVIENSVVEISCLIKNKGFGDKKVDLELREESAILKKRALTLKGSATRTTLKFSPQKRGFVHYTLNVISKESETTKANNIKSFLIDNRDRKARVLYIEGYPRAEFKFLRRALDGDESIGLVSLLRTGPDKFYRQGITNQDELRAGFPKTRQALFEYDAVILGSIERAFFSDSQLENLAGFVSERGGGFLMMGGSSALAEGGYVNSAIEKLLPVELPQNKNIGYFGNTFRDKFKLLITPEGYRNPILQLSPETSENREIWDALPDLEGYNIVGRAKPGASVIAVHPLSESDNPRIIIAQQRFGKGRSMIFASSSSWLWQMGMPHKDMSHERFWRQIMRWLALSAPEPIETNTGKETYVPGEQVAFNTDVRDSLFSPLNDAKVSARIKKPNGEIVEVPCHWSSDERLNYAGNFVPEQEGIYALEVEAYSSKQVFLGRSETAFLVEESKTEFNNSHLQSAFLKRIAEISGGKYYYQDEAKNLADEMSVMKSTYSKLVDHDLWDMPVWFMLVIVLLSVEWYVRRSRGLS